MKKILATFAVAALTATAGAHAANDTTVSKGEARLAKMLEGHVAGEPRSCISATLSNRLEIIDETALVYDAGETVYVARPHHPRSLDAHDILVFKRFGSQLCKHDIIHTVDRTSGIMTGVVFLDDFVPYRKQ